MAQVQSTTNNLYVACARAIAGEETFNKFSHIGLDKANMGSYSESTNALTTIATESGLGITAATVTIVTTTVTNDTVQAYKAFTAGASATVTGFGLFPASSNENMLFWCAFNAPQPLENGDQVNCTGKVQFKKGS